MAFIPSDGGKRSALCGRKLSPEHRAKLSAANRGKLRGKPSQETRERISAALCGRNLSSEHLAKALEQLAKTWAANRGRKYSPERCAKISAALLGKKASPSTRAKMSALRRGKSKVFSPEHLAKIREQCAKMTANRYKLSPWEAEMKQILELAARVASAGRIYMQEREQK